MYQNDRDKPDTQTFPKPRELSAATPTRERQARWAPHMAGKLPVIHAHALSALERDCRVLSFVHSRRLLSDEPHVIELGKSGHEGICGDGMAGYVLPHLVVMSLNFTPMMDGLVPV
jgi:hypothetical protein